MVIQGERGEARRQPASRTPDLSYIMESREPVNILLVDDQPAKLLSYEVILSDLGENLIKASSGREALDCLLKNRIALVLVDVCMPDMDGFELTSMIRNHPQFQKTAIILVSGLMTEDVDRLKGYVSGAVDYVSVPIVPEILRAKVSVFVDLFRKTEALERLNEALSEAAKKLASAYEASRLLAAIVESSDDAIIGQSLDGTIRTWNAGAERLYGYRAEEILGCNVNRLTPANRSEEEARILGKLHKGERVDQVETVRVRKDGRLLEVSLTISPIRGESGDIVGASQVARDITEQKRAAERLRQTQKLESLGVLAGGIAHDFNNLLVGILGNASLALSRLPSHSPGVAPIQAVVSAGERAAALTSQMLAYSGRGQFVLDRINLSAYIRQVMPLTEAAISRTVQFRLGLAEDLPTIEADTTQMQQLLMNLVINGAEAIPDGKPGTVTVTTRREEVDEHYVHPPTGSMSWDLKPGTYVVLEVRDNGAGMDEQTQARIFEPFFTTKFTGRGLGLAAALGIVRGHLGAIHVLSSPGHGTTFRVLLPAVAAPQDSAQEQPRRRDSLTGGGTVLVIDDEEMVRNLAEWILKDHGYTILLARDGEQGLKLFRENADNIRCVVLDLTMPVMSGEETLRRLREIRTDIPVILSSGFSEMEVVSRFEGKGLAGFLQKPYRSTTLLEKVGEVMALAGPHLETTDCRR